MKETNLEASENQINTTRANGQWASRESYDAIMERGSELIERGSDLLARANTRTTDLVRRYPVQAAVGGLVLGFFVGALIARRKV